MVEQERGSESQEVWREVGGEEVWRRVGGGEVWRGIGREGEEISTSTKGGVITGRRRRAVS